MRIKIYRNILIKNEEINRKLITFLDKILVFFDNTKSIRYYLVLRTRKDRQDSKMKHLHAFFI